MGCSSSKEVRAEDPAADILVASSGMLLACDCVDWASITLPQQQLHSVC